MLVIPGFEWLDARLLLAALRIVTAFNWLTGRDNFFLARVINEISYWLAFVCGCLLMFLFYDFLPGVMLLLGTLIYSTDKAVIARTEVERRKEERTEAPSLNLEMRLMRFRISGWGMFLIQWVNAFVFSLGFRMSFFWLVLFSTPLFLLGITNVIVAYCISVWRPPYHKSRALEQLKSLLTLPALKPVPVGSS